ncbi:MAG: leucine--tRNA ligase [Myxococcota bacterium]
MAYDPSKIESKWQTKWEESKVFELPRDLAELRKKPKYYVLDMFPYPSGAGLHVGHPEGYTATDVIARIKRAQGFNVMHPMGWDAFGLPAERAAVRENIHPAIITKRNIDNFRGQIKRLGFSYDWSREVSTTDPDYYKWTQWIFLKLYEKGLAYLSDVPVNWCPALGTVLANEEVKDGKYVETGDPVEQRVMRQWMLKITAYAERLLEDLEGLDWPEGVIEMQRNWIGKSEGLLFTAKVKGIDLEIQTFSAHFEAFHADTYVVIAADHPLLPRLLEGVENADEIATFCQQMVASRGAEENPEPNGIFTGRYLEDPINGVDIPIWVANFAIATYGTGVVKCSAHDERDFKFAKKFGIPLKIGLVPPNNPELEERVRKFEVCYTDMAHGILVDAGPFTGRRAGECRDAIIAYCQEKGHATSKVSYKLRDWLFSRQRYWGEPIPVVHLEDGSLLPLSEKDLPLELPPVDAYKPTDTGEPPLARASEDWLKVQLPGGQIGRRETNTMPQWGGSCWYYLRYLDPQNAEKFCASELEQYWMPVDLYIGGVEHAVLHLLYARFWHKVLFDCGVVSTKEPFQKLFNQGMILAHSYQDDAGKYYYPEEVEPKGNGFVVKASGKAVKTQVEKMSKSRYNVVNPDDVIAKYGADAMRLYELFMGPLDQVKPWQTSGVEGVYRFLHRVWRLAEREISNEPGASNPALWCLYHKTVKLVEEHTLALKFNTAISQMMIFVNEATASATLPKEIMQGFIRILAPYAPHICEEIWEQMREAGFVSASVWPKFDPALCEDDEITIAVQINGKRRDEIRVAKGTAKEVLEKMALASEQVQLFLNGATPKKIVAVPDRIVNIVV